MPFFSLLPSLFLACGTTPALVESWGADHQAALAGTTLDQPLRVRVYGQAVRSSTNVSTYGDTGSIDTGVDVPTPMADAEVTFRVTSGGGSLSAEVVKTDADGYATAMWTIGEEGEQKAVAEVFLPSGRPLDSSPIEYTAHIARASSFTDTRDGETYGTITVEGQTWMADNLRWAGGLSDVNDQAPDETYGRYYTWLAARSACPDGWHLPTTSEWEDLEVNMGLPPTERGFFHSDNRIGRAMKTTSGWDGDGNGSNTVGFNVVPAGTWLGVAAEHPIGSRATFWTDTEFSPDPDNAEDRAILAESDTLSNYASSKLMSLSVRCVSDQ